MLCSNSYKLSSLPSTTHGSLSTLLNNFYLAASIYDFQSFIFNVLQPSMFIYDDNCGILLLWRWHSDSNLVTFRSVLLTWASPLNDNHSPITSYKIHIRLVVEMVTLQNTHKKYKIDTTKYTSDRYQSNPKLVPPPPPQYI